MELRGYRDIRNLDQGPDHALFRALRVEDDAPVVLKTALVGRVPIEEAASGLRREYDLLSQLDLPGIARPLSFTFGEGDGAPVLVLADAGPENLKEWLAHGPLGTERFLELAIQLVEIVAGVHARHLVHGAINPFHVVVGPDRNLTLVDFAEARGGPARAPATDPAFKLGAAPVYVAPEQTGRMNRPVDHRADLYSVGATFYEMLSGAPPFRESDLIDVVHAQLATVPPPPRAVNPTVPAVLSDVVMKLLSKMPERRYQSIEALAFDLREAERQLRSFGAIRPFELGALDITKDLPFPEEVYERERETAELAGALTRVVRGPSELWLVTGAPGVGKSTLVEQLRYPVAEATGQFLVGRCDSRQKGRPYACFVDAFRTLLLGILAEPESIRADWRDRLRPALSTNESVIAELIPELVLLMGEPSSVPKLGPVETENRFNLVFQSFLQALAREDHPILLFLDDLQWADTGTLRLLSFLSSTANLRHLLLVGAFRPDEIALNEPLGRALEALRKPSVLAGTIALSELDLEGVTALCCRALRCDPARGRDLSKLVWKKTAGNPFFVRSLLRFLHQSGLLWFDAARRSWSWDLSGIESAQVTENVADLLVVALQRLPEPTQNVLKIASCIGGAISIELVAAVSVQPRETVACLLSSSLLAGLLVAPEIGVHRTFAPSYRFAHDRVQQAAYSLLTESERRAAHMEVARRLSEGLSDKDIDEYVFEIANHLHLGTEPDSDQNERLARIDVYLRAARKARRSSAHEVAVTYLSRSIALLPDDAWQTRHAVTFDLYRDVVESAYMAGDDRLGDELFASADEHADSGLERAELYDIRIVASTLRGVPAVAITWGARALASLDVKIPDESAMDTVSTEMAAVQDNLRGRSMAELATGPEMRGAKELACLRTLSNLLAPAYVSGERLFPFLVARMVNLSLLQGNSAHSAQAYACYAMILPDANGDYAMAHAFGQLGLTLVSRFHDPVQECRALGVFAAFVNHWRAPLRSSVPLLRRAVAAGLESGDVQYASYWSNTIVGNLFNQGKPLPEVLGEIENATTMRGRTKVRTEVELHCLPGRQAIRCLRGLTSESGGFNDDEFDEDSFIQSVAGDPILMASYELVRLEVSYLFGDLPRARAFSTALGSRRPVLRGTLTLVEHNFYTSLTLAASIEPGSVSEMMATIDSHQVELGKWAANSPQNFRHKYLLVEAERARLLDRVREAGAFYDEAIELAGREQFFQDEAIANELAGRFYRGLGRRRIAIIYFSAALAGYARWGASAKVTALEEELRDFGPFDAAGSQAPGPGATMPASAALDLLSMSRAAETISSETLLDQLLEKLMTVCLTAAGAERGALVLEEGGRSIVREFGPPQLGVVEGTPIERSEQLPMTLVEHAKSTGQPVILADAARRGAFVSDPYVRKHNLASALAIPIQLRGKLIGALYVENNLATSVFTPDRVSVLKPLSTQIALSLEIVALVEKLTNEMRERQHAEAAVRLLAEASLRLSQSLDYETTLSSIAELCVPLLADWCVIDLLEEDHRVRRIAASHADPTHERLVSHLEETSATSTDSPSPTSTVIREGHSVLVVKLTEAVLKEYAPGFADILRKLDMRTLMAVPMVARERPVGAIGLARGGPDCPYGPRDLELAEELARRAAVAIDNARFYRNSQDAVRLRDEFLTVASHELNTPVASLQLALARLAKPGALSSPEKVHGIVQTAQRQTFKLTRLISELLSVSRIQAGRFDLQLEEVDLAEVVREVVNRFGTDLARAKSELSIRADAPVTGTWDRQKLDQVVTNLLSNAVKFGRGKPISIVVARTREGARLIIEDHGIGMAPERLPRIFERFERGVSDRDFGGLGLGLYIVKQIVEALGGSVRARSSRDSGTIFMVDLPHGMPKAPA
jgi:predicted ATPase/signal transduction histidine kinase